MVLITYNNIRDAECEFVKYVSQKRGKFKINIIRFREFRDELIDKYSEENIRRFFRLFPYDLDTEVRPADKITSIKLEIEFYNDLRLITIEGHEFVLVDQSTEELEGVSFLTEISSQPILLEEFVVISLFDFINIAQQDLYYSLQVNLLENEIEETKYVEQSEKDFLYS